MFKQFSDIFHRIITQLAQYPGLSFFILLVLLFGTIALGHLWRTPQSLSEDAKREPKQTALFDLSQNTAFVTVPAKVKKESIVHLTALVPGIVSGILTSPGRSVVSGQTILTLTNDYQSGGAELKKQLAAQSDALTQEIASIDKRITALKEKQTKHDDSLDDTDEALALDQLKKERALRKSTLEQSQTSLQISQTNDAAYKPKVFVNGTVESIRVKRGDWVIAGQVLATITTPKGATTLEALLDKNSAELFDPSAETSVQIGTEKFTLRPTYFSRSENENGLFSVLFTLSETMRTKLINGEFVTMDLPLRKSTESLALVPIDAIFQDDSHAWILVEHDGVAEARNVSLGNLHGSFAEILDGVERNSRIILNRSVLAGDTIVPTAL